MAMKSTTPLRTCFAAVVLAAAAAAAACGGSTETSPTAPTPVTGPPAPAPTPPPPPPPPPSPGRLEATIHPNPVPWSGRPVDAAGCQNVPNTWFYDIVIQNVGGSTVTLTERQNSFNGVERAPIRLDPPLVIEPGASITVPTRWCSSSPGPHTAQSNFSGRDAQNNLVSQVGPAAQLQARP